MAYQHIIVTRAEAIATITFNRPEALNALNSELFHELVEALEEIQSNQEIRVLVLTGAGDKAFVAGADIKELDGLSVRQGRELARFGQAVFNKIAALPIAVIAAVNGYALGGGAEIALCCDFIYAVEDASIGLPESSLGLIPLWGGTQRLARLIGPNQAKEMIFTGKIISAEDARALGIVNQVFCREKLMPEVMATARALALKGRVALQAAKEAIASGLETDLATGLLIEQNAFALCMTSEDAAEGVRAFIEKRKPVFKA